LFGVAQVCNCWRNVCMWVCCEPRSRSSVKVVSSTYLWVRQSTVGQWGHQLVAGMKVDPGGTLRHASGYVDPVRVLVTVSTRTVWHRKHRYRSGTIWQGSDDFFTNISLCQEFSGIFSEYSESVGSIPRSFSFVRSRPILWSTLSNALVKSTNKARTEPPWSRVLHQEWRIQTNAWVVVLWNVVLSHQTDLGPGYGARKSQSQSPMNDSRIFPRTGSKEIRLIAL